MVLLVKLMLPPSLAFPTGLAWWLRPSGPQPNVQPPAIALVTDAPSVSSQHSVEAPPFFQAPARAVLSSQAWLLLSSGALSLGLFAWMLARWRQVALTARQAVPVPPELEELLSQVCESLQYKRLVRLKLSPGTSSPAVFGLFRPVILLPQSLPARLSRTQLRTVLLHELIHLRRGDVWINCAQALLQIVYWWHPLLWLANSRIRLLREEAVDDSVMCVLQADAGSYPQTLLEVAKLALRRPLSSLALLGILETKNALCRRIRRLVNLPSPPKPGLTLVSSLSILAFGAVAVPMGQAPPKPVDSALAAQANVDAWPDPRFSGYAKVSLAARFLIVDSASLELFLPAAAGAQVPFLVASNELAEVERKLGQAGAEAFPRGEMLNFAQLSGGHFHYLIGGVTNNMVNYLTRTRADGTTVVTGAECTYVPTRPDWVPLDFTLVPWAEQASTLCQMQLAIADNTNSAQAAEVSIPAGGAMFWLVSLGTSPGKSEIVLLKEEGSEPVRSPAAEAPHNDQTEQKTTVDNLVQEGRLAFELGKLDNAEAKLRQALVEDPKCSAAYYYLNLISEARAKAARPPTNHLWRFGSNLTYVATGRQTLAAELEGIRLNQISFDHLTLAEVVRSLNEQLKNRDSFTNGRDVILYQRAQATSGHAGNWTKSEDISNVLITILPALTDVRLDDVLDAIVRVAIPPVKYSIQDNTVVFSPAVDESKNLYTRVIKVDSQTFLRGLSAARGNANLDTQEAKQKALLNFFLGRGVDFQPPRMIFLDSLQGTLLVRATIRELDAVEKAINELDVERPQINIRVKFLKTSAATLAGLGRSLNFLNMDGTNFSKILTPSQTAVVLKAIESDPGSLLNAASVTTLSGRQTRVDCVDLSTIVTNQIPAQIRLGPAIDLVPTQKGNDWKIALTTIASLTELLEGDESGPAPGSSRKRQEHEPASAVPRIRLRQITARPVVPDGYTVLLANPADEKGNLAENPDSPERRFAVLITPTLIDSAGNRVHSEQEVDAAMR